MVFRRLAHAASSGSGWLGLVASDVSTSDVLTPFFTSDDTTRSPVGLGGYIASGVGVTPDGRTAWTTNAATQGNPGSVIPVDLTQSTPLAGGAVTVPGATTSHVCTNGSVNVLAGLGGVAITPNGRTLYSVDAATNALYVVDVSQAPALPGTPVALPSGAQPEALAVTTDGARVLVADAGTDEVSVVSVASGQIVAEMALATGAKPFGIAVTPDGRHAYVAEGGLNKVVPIDLSNNQVGAAIAVGSGPDGVAVSPDGQHVYVTNGGTGLTADSMGNCQTTNPGSNTVSVIATQTNTVVATVTGVSGPSGPAITPDGRTVYVAPGYSNGASSAITPINAATDTAGTAFTTSSYPFQVAISPDQGPVANFTVTGAAAGQATSFDASVSTAPGAAIASYHWDFGDGATQTTTTPTTSHVYASAGSFQATLTVTDSAGTSTQEVYTGQTALQHSSGLAQQTKSVNVAVGPQPVVSLSSAHLDFGTTAVGHPAGAQTLTVTNTGNAPLATTSVAIGGPNATDFQISAGNCASNTIPARGTCSETITFTPTTNGPATAQIAISDSATGSPHTSLLIGTGSTTAAITGHIYDGASAGMPAVGGAQVQVCAFGTLGGCKYATTDATGAYTVAGLKAGTYALEVFPPAASRLFAGAADVTTTVGAPTTQDFMLQAPHGLPAGVTLDGRPATAGPPTSFWLYPSTLGAPLEVPGGVAAGAYGVTTARFYAQPAGGGNAGTESRGTLTVTYRYDAQGVPRFISETDQDPFAPPGAPTNITGVAGSWTVGLDGTPIAGSTDLRGARVNALLTPPANGPLFHGAVSYDLAQYAYTYAAGAAASRGLKAAAATAENVSGSRGAHASGAPQGVPNSCPVPQHSPWKPNPRFYRPDLGVYQYDFGPLDLRTFDPQTGKFTTASGDVLYPFGTPLGPMGPWSSQPGESTGGVDVYQPATGQKASWPEFEQPSTYTGNHGTADLWAVNLDTGVVIHEPVDRLWGYRTTASPRRLALPQPLAHASQAAAGAGIAGVGFCQPQPPNSWSASAYVDPSGVIATPAGVPVAGARVVLLRAGARNTFAPVTNGSATMSAANRRNPDRADALGHFGWDVLAGLYRVQASHPGCSAARGSGVVQTRALPVPPPVTNLRLLLRCPHLRRARTRVTVRARNVPVGRLALFSHVTIAGRHGGGRPQGLVAFYSGHRRLAEVPLDATTATASVTIAKRSASSGPITARYAGDGYLIDSQARVHAR